MTADHVWMAHLWEVPGFSKGTKKNFPRALFQEEVLDFIKNGIATQTDMNEEGPPNAKKGQTLGERKAEIKGADVWILTLAKDDTEKTAEYPGRITQLKKAIREHIEGAKFHTVFYERPEQNDEEGDDTMELLFEYDPNGPPETQKERDDKAKKGKGKEVEKKDKKKWVRFFYQHHLPMFDGEPGKFS
jgi:hypothetical protein